MENAKIICNQPKEHDCNLEDAPTIECISRGCPFYTKVGPRIEIEDKEQKLIETLKKALRDCLLQKQPACPGPNYYWTRGCWKRKPGHALDATESSVGEA